MRMSCDCLCFIVPPYLLDKYAKSDDKKIRDSALSTLREMRKLRSFRAAALNTINVRLPSAVAPKPKVRRIFSCENTSDLSRKLMMNEGDPVNADIAVREAYDYSGLVWDYFHQFHNRSSIDDRGMTIVSSVHYSENGEGFDNAFWDSHQMVYGDGGEVFGRMTKSIDVVGHELAHGITQYSAGLPYENQSGALNEHFSDVFGVVIRQWHEKQSDPAAANWLIGDGLLLNGQALRSMSAPGTANDDDPQPDHMSGFRHLPNDPGHDSGGVHINSGIPNHAFYLAAVAIDQPAWETAARIWYITLNERLNGITDFVRCANETISVARDFFDDDIAGKVAQAWIDVGVITSHQIGPLTSLASFSPSAVKGGASKKKKEKVN